tara:strand:+ start:21801 stop:23312 length:1512 start_codon:yes stop_codon:yes gene_type:complete
MNSFPEQTGSFSYLFGFQPDAGISSWNFNFVSQNIISGNFSSPERQQDIYYNSYNAEISNSYLFLSNPYSGSAEVYKNYYEESSSGINEYIKINKITGNGISGLSGFGGSMKAADDILIIGAPDTPVNSNQKVGAVFLFNEYNPEGIGTTGGAEWGQELVISGTETSGLFGNSICTLKQNSEHIVAIGAIGENSGDGAVYIYGQTLSNLIKKINSNISGSKNFGKSLFLSRPNSSYLTVGCDQSGSGVVEIFKESVSGQGDFHSQGLIKPGNGHSGDMFGYLIDGDDVSFMVGSPNHNQSGLVYYYEYNHESGSFGLKQEILPYDLGLGDNFGKNISIDNELAVIASDKFSGKAYIYEKKQGLWDLKSEISGDLDNSQKSFGGNLYGSHNAAFNKDTLIIGSAENEINYYFTTGHLEMIRSTGFSMSGSGGKFYDNDGNFLYGYNTFEEVVISGNVFSGNHNIFINGNVLNSNCSRSSGTLNAWSISGESGLSYYMSIIDVED